MKFLRVVGAEQHASVIVEHDSDAVVRQLETEAVLVGIIHPLRYVQNPRPVDLRHGCICNAHSGK